MNHTRNTFKNQIELVQFMNSICIHFNFLSAVSLPKQKSCTLSVNSYPTRCFRGSHSKFSTDLQLTQQQTEGVRASAPPTRFKFRV